MKLHSTQLLFFLAMPRPLTAVSLVECRNRPKVLFSYFGLKKVYEKTLWKKWPKEENTIRKDQKLPQILSLMDFMELDGT